MLDSETATTSHGTATRIRARVEKHDFSASYDQPTPAAYYRSLQDLDYRLPELARPIIGRYLDAIRRERPRDVVRVIDLCCGYGVNAALWNHRIDMDALYQRYAVWPHAGKPAKEVIEEERRLFAMCRRQPLAAEVIGIDVAANALDYAREAGLLAHALPINLEQDEPSRAERSLLSQADLVTVTGGLSYIGHNSFERLLSCFPSEGRPWIVWFPLRHLDVAPVVVVLDRFGYRTDMLTTLRQRRFKDADERRVVLRQLGQRGLDPKDAERGYSHAVCRVSRPSGLSASLS
jgi:SAM-dependent methyltransferase